MNTNMKQEQNNKIIIELMSLTNKTNALRWNRKWYIIRINLKIFNFKFLRVQPIRTLLCNEKIQLSIKS